MVLCRLRLLRRPYSSPDPCSRKEKPTRRPVGRDWSAGELVAARPLPRRSRSLPGLQGLGRHRRRQPDHSRSLLRRPRRRHHSPHLSQHDPGKLPPRRPRQHRNRHPRQARRETRPQAAAHRAPHRGQAAGHGVLMSPADITEDQIQASIEGHRARNLELRQVLVEKAISLNVDRFIDVHLCTSLSSLRF